jgi:hypothetical protein
MPPTVGPRVEFDPDHYPRIRVWDSAVGRDRFIYLHRCVAYAHGLMDSLWAPVDVHHADCDNWNNHPSNLEAVERDAHAAREPHVRNLK